MQTSVSTCLDGDSLHKGPLDFAFVVHPREVGDIIRAYPELADHKRSEILSAARKSNVHILSNISCRLDGRSIRGELLSIPYLASEFMTEMRGVRKALRDVVSYCEERCVRVAGLGALVPSVTRSGRLLASHAHSIGITTGHTFTAIAIAEHVRQVERCLNKVAHVAVLGAAGSTGRAAVRCLAKDCLKRNLTLVDRPSKRRLLEKLGAMFTSPVCIATKLDAIRKADVVVCVTNATQALVTSDLLSDGCVVIDDAQPENVSYQAVVQRPDITVVKCLARVPSLHCQFDYGLFPVDEVESKQEYSFTCLAETAMLAANNHRGHFTVGDPTDAQIRHLENLAQLYDVSIAPFHSFPEIGAISSDRFM